MAAPNYVNPVTKGNSLKVVSAVFGGIALLSVSARVWARIVIIHKPGWDDYIILAALAFAVAFTAMTNVVAYQYNLDRYEGRDPSYLQLQAEGIANWRSQTLDIPLSNHVDIAYYLWWLHHIYTAATATLKVSILLFYKRVLARSSGKVFPWLNTILMGVVVVHAIAVILALVFACNPVRAFWMRYSPEFAAQNEFSCPANADVLQATAIISVLTDFAVVILPLFFLRNLNMGRSQKWGLRAIFSLGFLICGASIARTYYIFLVQNDLEDYAWDTYDTLLWAIIEMFVAITCASAPALKPFFNLYVKGSLSVLRSGGKASDCATDGAARRRFELSSIGHKRKDSAGMSTIDKDLEMQTRASDASPSSVYDERNASSRTELRAPDRVLKSVTYGVEYDQRPQQSRSRRADLM